jgi:hypothetical protein
MRFATLAIFAALLLTCDPSAAARRTITWEDVMTCVNTVEFDDAKYQETAVRNTIEVIFDPPILPVVHVPKPEDMAKLDLDQFKTECTNAVTRAEGLRLISLPGLQDYWAAKVEQMRDACAYGIIEIRGFSDPAALREYQPAATSCSRYVDALEGKTDIVQVWRDTITESCRRNLDPARCASNSLAEGNGPNGAEWIRLYVYGFGWNNCANKFRVENINYEKSESMRSELEKRFKRLFKTTRDKSCH